MENQDSLPGEVEALINMALLDSDKSGLEFTKLQQNYKALYDIVSDWVSYFGTFGFESRLIDGKQQISVQKRVPIIQHNSSSAFPIDEYLTTLEGFFVQSHIWRNSDYLQEEHIRIIFYLHAKRYKMLVKATQENKAKKTWSNDSKPSTSSFCSMDMYLEFKSELDQHSSLSIELKLLTKSDLESPFDGINTEISAIGKRRKHRDRGNTTIRLLLNSALEQVKCYYGFSSYDAEKELRIPRYAVIVTPFKLFYKFSPTGYCYFSKDITKISHQAVKEISNMFKFQLFACEFHTVEELDQFKEKMNAEPEVLSSIIGFILKRFSMSSTIIAFRTRDPVSYFHLCSRLKSEAIQFFETEEELKNMLYLDQISFLDNVPSFDIPELFENLTIK